MRQFRAFEKKIGYRFKKQEFLIAALTHPSYRYENPDVRHDNQRLEFLGDSVLGLLAADRLMQENPDSDEGALTKKKSAIASGSALAAVGRELDLGAVLFMGKGEAASGGSERESNLEDALEALIGAVWLDGGLKAARRFFEKNVLAPLKKAEPVLLNPKGVLQEYAQKNGISIPDYKTVEETGPDHARRFTVEVTVDNYGYRGEGASRREAEKKAAAKAVRNMVK